MTGGLASILILATMTRLLIAGCDLPSVLVGGSLWYPAIMREEEARMQ